MFMRYKVTVNTSHYPKDVPFEVPEGWALSTINDLFTINPKNIADDSLVAAFVPMASISDGFSDSFKYEERCWRDVKTGFTHFADSDVAVAKISPCLENRKSFVAKALPNGIGAGTTELFVFRSRHILPDYTLLFFKSDCFISACVGTFNGVVGQQRAARNVIEEMMFPIPPVPEQSRIVEKVEELFGEIDEIERGRLFVKANIEAAKSRILDLAIHGKLVPQYPSDEPAIELLKRINPAFKPSDNLHYEGDFPNGWVSASLGEVSNYGHCISVPVEKIGNDDWVLELEDIEKDTGRILQRLSKKDRKISGIRHQFKKGQILYSKLRTYLNKVLIADEDGFCTTEIIPITPINGVNALFLIIVLRSQYFLDYTQNCCYGVKMPRLGTNDAKKAVIPLPPFEEQGRIVAAVKGLFLTITQIGHVIENQE